MPIGSSRAGFETCPRVGQGSGPSTGPVASISWGGGLETVLPQTES